VSSSINKLLRESLLESETEREVLGDLLTQMLDINPRKRISPKDALNHRFFNR